MQDSTLHGTYVSICDWRGRIVWISSDDLLANIGDVAWEHLMPRCQELAKSVFSRVVTLQEEQTAEFTNKDDVHFRAWMWPLRSPDAAVCILAINIPKELQLLTGRERQALQVLSQGYSTKEIARELDVSASTIHTHLRRAREKLNLSSVEALTGFAARYCNPNAAPSQSLIREAEMNASQITP